MQKEELIALKQAKLINNTAYVHFALRYENPFCDRPIEIVPKEFALRWAIPEVSVYKALAKLKKLGTINIKSGKVVIEWAFLPDAELSEPDAELSNAKKIIKVDKKLSDRKEDYQIGKKIIKIDKKLSDRKEDYQIGKNRGSKPAPGEASNSLQTYSEKKEDPDSLSEGKFPDFLKRVPDLPEGERENFLSFCFRKAAELPQPPVLVEKWIECHSQQLVEAFRRENSVSLNGKDPDRGQEKSAAAVTKVNDSAVPVVKKVYTPEEIEAILQRSIEETARRRAAKGGTYDT